MKPWILLPIIIAALPFGASAQENPFGQPEFWREKHRQERREYYRRHYYAPPVRAWRQSYRPAIPPVPHGHHAHCLLEVRALGTPHVTEDAARGAAQRHWQATVRYDHGEKYMSIETAQGVKWRCARAETNETAVGRTVEALTGDAWRMRCEVVARPCRTELQSR